MSGLTVGIIGLGGAGRAHARRFQRHPHVAQVTALDTHVKPWRDVEVTDDLDAFLDRVDAVSICTPDQTHRDYIVAAIVDGAAVIVPCADGRRVVELCEALERDAVPAEPLNALTRAA